MTSTPPLLQLDAADFHRLMEAVQQLGGVDALLTAAMAGAGRKAPTRRTVPYRHAEDVFGAVDRDIISREDARKLLGHRGEPPARRRLRKRASTPPPAGRPRATPAKTTRARRATR